MGLFSKIKNVFKKVVRKVGRVIKKVTKPITKVFKKVLKPFGKLFSKLGWVGTLALGIMLPGIGTAFSSWFGSTFGGTFSNLGPWFDKAMKTFNKITKPFKNAFKSVSETLQFGVDKVAQAFGYEAPTMSFVDGALQSTGATGKTFTDGLTDWLTGATNSTVGPPAPGQAPADLVGPPLPDVTGTESLLSPSGTGTDFDPFVASDSSALNVEIPKPTEGLNIINKGDVLDGKTITGFTGENTINYEKGTWWDNNISNNVNKIRDTKIGNFATFGDLGRGGQTVMSGIGICRCFFWRR